MSQPSRKATQEEISDMVVGMPADEAVDIVVEHISRTQGFKKYPEIYKYWNKLNDDQKLRTVRTALSR